MLVVRSFVSPFASAGFAALFFTTVGVALCWSDCLTTDGGHELGIIDLDGVLHWVLSWFFLSDQESPDN